MVMMGGPLVDMVWMVCVGSMDVMCWFDVCVMCVGWMFDGDDVLFVGWLVDCYMMVWIFLWFFHRFFF